MSTIRPEGQKMNFNKRLIIIICFQATIRLNRERVLDTNQKNVDIIAQQAKHFQRIDGN